MTEPCFERGRWLEGEEGEEEGESWEEGGGRREGMYRKGVGMRSRGREDKGTNFLSLICLGMQGITKEV